MIQIERQMKERERKTYLVDPQVSKPFQKLCDKKDVKYSHALEYGIKMAMIELEKMPNVRKKKS